MDLDINSLRSFKDLVDAQDSCVKRLKVAACRIDSLIKETDFILSLPDCEAKAKNLAAGTEKIKRERETLEADTEECRLLSNQIRDWILHYGY